MVDWLKKQAIRMRNRRDERGDVPGWVMITVMTIGLVTVIFTAFSGAVTTYVQNALDQLK